MFERASVDLTETSLKLKCHDEQKLSRKRPDIFKVFIEIWGKVKVSFLVITTYLP